MKELHEVINEYIEKYGYQRYMEIGVRKCYTFDKVECDEKVGIDPNLKKHYDYLLKITSDEFFKYEPYENIDIILIDGLHESEQVIRDIENSLTILNDNGVILVHDVLPKHSDERIPGKSHTGDVWKGFLSVCLYRNDIDYCTLSEAKTGIGVIYKVDCPVADKLNWTIYEKAGKELLNVQ